MQISSDLDGLVQVLELGKLHLDSSAHLSHQDHSGLPIIGFSFMIENTYEKHPQVELLETVQRSTSNSRQQHVGRLLDHRVDNFV